MAVQEDITPSMMSMKDILGTAVGQDQDGELAIIVYVDIDAKNLGEVIRSIPVDSEASIYEWRSRTSFARCRGSLAGPRSLTLQTDSADKGSQLRAAGDMIRQWLLLRRHAGSLVQIGNNAVHPEQLPCS